MTITRLAEDRFYFVTGSAFGVRDRSTIERHLPADGSVEIVEHTSAKAVLNLCGPRSREVLGQLTAAPLDNERFPYMSAREIDIGYAPVLALRVTYLGEQGFELHVPVEYALYLYERLWAAGERHGIANVGYRAINGLPITMLEFDDKAALAAELDELQRVLAGLGAQPFTVLPASHLTGVDQ